MQPRNFRKAGFLLILVSILVAVVTSQLGMSGYVRIAVLTFGFGAGFILLVIAGILPPIE
jgi:hypothetical protein